MQNLRMLFFGVLCSLAGAAASAPGTVDPPSLEYLLRTEITGASRVLQPLAEAPASASILSAEEIRTYGFRTLGEALGGVRGIYTSYERDYSYLGVRGFARPGDYNTRVLLMTDGVRRNDPLYDTAMIGREAPIDIDWVKRLEFVPGPASALYGPNAIFGVANAVLWSGSDIDGSRVSTELGSGGSFRVGYLAGRGMGHDGNWMLGISAYSRQGEDLYFREFDIPGASSGIAHRLDGESTVKGIAKFAKGEWSLDMGFSTRRKNVPTAFYGTAFDTSGNVVVDQYAYADLGHTHAISNVLSGKLDLRAGSYQFDGQYVYPALKNRDWAKSAWLGADYLLVYSGIPDHRLLFGAEVQSNHRLDQGNYDVTPRIVRLDDRRDEMRSGIYVEDEWRINARWMSNFGVRADRAGSYGAVSPRVALIFHPVPEAALKAMFGKAFRPPNNYEHYYNDGNIIQKANPDLRQERVATYELGADYAVSSRLRLSGSYYRYRIDDLIDQVIDPADGLLVFVNRPAMHARGLDLEAELTMQGGAHFKASVSRQALSQASGEPVNSPHFLGKLLIDGPLPATGWTLGANIQAVSPRQSTIGGRVPGYVVGNVVFRRAGPPSDGDWTLGIYNLTGHRYSDPASTAVASGAVVQDGLQLRLMWELFR